jgi:hypothetical protein
MYPAQQCTNKHTKLLLLPRNSSTCVVYDGVACCWLRHQPHLTLLLALTARASSFRTLSSPAHVNRHNTQQARKPASSKTNH